MYGKHFESMYEGSMYGAGIAVFAVWGYIISHARFSKIELNPKKLADTLGGTVQEIMSAIEFLCKPDPESRHKAAEGRRLVKEGEFQYFLPSWDDYQRIRNAEELREYNRRKQAQYRAGHKKTYSDPKPGRPTTNEAAALAAEQREDTKTYDALAAERK